MADPKFFTVSSPLTLADIVKVTGAKLILETELDKEIIDVAPLQLATSDHVSFLDNKKYNDDFKTTKAGACFVRAKMVEHAPDGVVCLVHENPYMAYAMAANAFYADIPPTVENIAPSAVIDDTATLGKNCDIGANVVIGKDATIGNGCRLHPNVVIGDGVTIGNETEIFANATITHAMIGSRVKIFSGAVLGDQGFGFAIGDKGFITVPQLGRVIIEDDVQIGSNTTIDRGAGPDTVIGQGTRIDNLVQIGHNVKIGKYTVFAGQVGVSGSTEIGNGVMIGGQSGLAGHIKIGDGSKLMGGTGVMRDLPPKSEVMGSPAMPVKQFFRQVAILSKMVSRKRKD